MKLKNTQPGFTLIEVMIVVAIIAILASIALPSYVESVQRSRRADAVDALLNESQRAERLFTTSNSYAGFAPTATSPAEFYTIAISNNTATTYTLTATATGSQAGDTDCLTLTLNHQGVRGPSEACWNR